MKMRRKLKYDGKGNRKKEKRKNQRWQNICRDNVSIVKYEINSIYQFENKMQVQNNRLIK